MRDHILVTAADMRHRLHLPCIAHLDGGSNRVCPWSRQRRICQGDHIHTNIPKKRCTIHELCIIGIKRRIQLHHKNLLSPLKFLYELCFLLSSFLSTIALSVSAIYSRHQLLRRFHIIHQQMMQPSDMLRRCTAAAADNIKSKIRNPAHHFYIVRNIFRIKCPSSEFRRIPCIRQHSHVLAFREALIFQKFIQMQWSHTAVKTNRIHIRHRCRF